eukprot:scaffold45517_cov29-Phaeocystis_antarctica.AAC.1
MLPSPAPPKAPSGATSSSGASATGGAARPSVRAGDSGCSATAVAPPPFFFLGCLARPVAGTAAGPRISASRPP